jgi:arylsulfatase A-like enzyme
MISRLDRDVGRILDRLKTLGLAENTLVLVTSDNGPHTAGGILGPQFFRSGGDLSGGKWYLSEGGIRVPLLASWPGTIAPGSVVHEPLALWDLLPTLTEIAGISRAASGDGLSLVPLWKGEGEPRHGFLYWETFTPHFQGQAVRQGRWKAIRQGLRSAQDPVQLFDLDTDPGEHRDVAGAHCALLNSLRMLMNTARQAPAYNPAGEFDIVPLSLTPCPAGSP